MIKYNNMKESGIKWIGKIPTHWDVVKNKFLGTVKTGGTPSTKKREYWDNGSIPWLPSQMVKNDDVRKPQKFITEKGLKKSSTKLIHSPATLYALTGATCGNVAYLYYDATANQSVSALEFNEKVIGRFHFYSAIAQGKQIVFHSSGGAQTGVNQEDIKNLFNALPPLKEQNQIISFLDNKTGKIDVLIDKKQRKIELLKEKQTALINQAITTGLNPNAPLKDSGVDWLGRIPKDWKVPYLRYYIGKMGSGLTPRGGSETYVDEGIPLIRSQNVHFDGLRLDDVAYITDEVHESMSNSVVYDGDVLLNITGASIGRCCIVKSDSEMNVNQHVCILRTKETLEAEYLNYFIQSDYGQMQVELNMSGANREGLTLDGISNFIIPIPGKSEQIQIIEYLNENTEEINQLVGKEEQKIELLKEYRQSLISEVVTGKIDVRDEVSTVSANGQQAHRTLGEGGEVPV